MLSTKLLVGSLAIAGLTLAVLAETPAAKNGATTRPATQPSGRSADQVMKELSGQLETSPVIEPSHRSIRVDRGDGANPRTRTTYDPAVLGAAPGTQAAKLRREGEFVVNRLGRMVRAANGTQMLFAFEADAKNAAAEAPVFLLPCEKLQSMEEVIQERGESVLFVISGQITSYRGANYMLPTMMKLAVDRGNLER